MDLRLDLRLSQKLVMTPQLQQAIKLLQLSRLELQQVLAQHLVENPLLEDLALEIQEEEAVAGEEGIERPKVQENELPGEAEEAPMAVKESESLSPEEWDNLLGSDWRPAQRDDVPQGDEEFPSYEQTLTKPTSLEDHLEWQLRLSSLEGDDRDIGRMIIGNLDEDGYLRIPLEELAEDGNGSIEQVERV
ncbi:MAG: hypothetical protein KC643_07995, partial [Nitrospira sp.]|nr:hypothetical protein [Nitrospira sp.]